MPSWEYVPDGEPHVFGDRLYIYGSHDRANGTAFCQEDYVVWSAPIDDLTEWRCEGISYRKTQDPFNADGSRNMWAPDVCQGSDGRYYLYYCLEFVPRIGIAVSDHPAGPFEFYDYVRFEDGVLYEENLPFDPGILFEDKEHIYLYTGFGCRPLPYEMSEEALRSMPQFEGMPEEQFKKIQNQVSLLAKPSKYASCLHLAPDMKTIIKEVDTVLPSVQTAEGTSFEEHPFFEASSVRKIKDIYYYVYSSLQGHELCYATSAYPDRDFEFKGVIVSNQDLGYAGNENAKNYGGNNHGGLVEVKGQWYIFYHRHTHANQFSRQGCAEKVAILPDGSIPQVEMTSCGLSGKALPANEICPASVICNLMGPNGASFINQEGMPEDTPCLKEVTEDEPIQILHNLQSQAVFGVKYLQFEGEKYISITAKGRGGLEVRLDNEEGVVLANIQIHSERWISAGAELICSVQGQHAVYFKAVEVAEALDVKAFQFS